ncbi:hypothetical protein A1QK_06485 [Vibrio genomosp. F10 str. 9ZD137]|nr:hypothetical protein A1QK_06485 [Vibrio genomosp. F10 str. 9ZD137]
METIQTIYRDLDDLYEETKFIFESWMRNIAEKEVRRSQRGDKKERTNYQLSFEFHGSSFRIRWIYVRFVKNGERIIRIAKPLAIPRSHCYSKSKFKHAELWELDLICKIEEVLYPIRVKKSALMKAHQTLLRANKLVGSSGNYSSSKERVVPTSNTISKYKQRYL